ncbi:Methionyl-tRNA formyltransferase [Mycolicibacterium aubagnense]
MLRPAKPNEPEFVAELAELAPDCCAVVAYGALLRDELLAVPRFGWINLHFSVLPAWRGAAPVQAAIAAGDEVTGATTFQIERALDSGPVYGVLTEAVRPIDTAGDLLARLADAGAGLLGHELDGVEDGALTAVPQPIDGVTIAPKVTVEDARVRWDLPAHVVDRRIRAVTPNPGAWTEIGDLRVKLGPVVPVEAEPLAPGGIRVQKAGVLIGTGSTPVRLGMVQPPGKKSMNAADWARGARLDEGGGPVKGPSEQNSAGREGRDRGKSGGDRARQGRPNNQGRSGGRDRPDRQTGPVAAATGRPRTPGTARPAPQAARSGTSSRVRRLRAVSQRDAYANLALPAILRERDITGRDAAFATELTYGTCRCVGLLDAVIEVPPAGPPTGSTRSCWNYCRLGAYQLLRTRVDAHAAVDTTVEQAGIEFDSVRAGFVNGVLRTIAGKDEAAWVAELAPSAAADPIGHTAFTHAHPRWVAQAFADALGADAGELDAMLTSDDERPVVHLAARPGVISADELAAAVGGDVGRYSPYAVYLPGGDPGQLDPIRDGMAQVQDEGSQLVARALTEAPLEGNDTRWLDLCSGPGGKTAMLAAIAARCGAEVTAVEPTEHRADSGRTQHLRHGCRGAAGRRPRIGSGAGILRPGSGRRAVHRPGRAAPPARGAVAPAALGRAGAGPAAA